jgi:fluoroquinolone transport system permease protein
VRAALAAFRGLGSLDLKNIRRDPMLRGIVFVPLALAAFLHYGVPALAAKLWESYSFDLTAYYGLLMSAIVQIPPMLFGTVAGFLLLDQRDDQTLMALRVTPMELKHYVAYRVLAPVVLSAVTIVALVRWVGLVEISLAAAVVGAVGTAPLAPLTALAMATFAQNKIQGFALQKASGVFIGPPLLAYFVPAHWQLAFGALPTFWTMKVWWGLHAAEPQTWLYLAAGLAYQALLLLLLFRRFHRVMTT